MDILNEVAQAPLWAQLMMALLLVIFVGLVVSSFLTPRRYRRRFTELAGEFGQNVVSAGDGSAAFSTTVEERRFEIKHDLRSSRGSYRGPQGHLLVSSTALASGRWELHQVDIEPGVVRARKLFGHNTSTSGDAAFDARFSVREGGVPVREQWLDAPTRAAIERLYESPVALGPLWIQEQQLSHIARAPWKGMNAGALRELLKRQGALASALDRTAGWRA